AARCAGCRRPCGRRASARHRAAGRQRRGRARPRELSRAAGQRSRWRARVEDVGAPRVPALSPARISRERVRRGRRTRCCVPSHPFGVTMRLDRIVLREIRLELKEPFRISSGEVRERRILLLELHDASGATAWSECVAGEAPNYSSETIDTAWIVIAQWVAPRVLGKTFDHPGIVHEMLDEDFRGHNMAKASVEMGLWALAATMAGQPLARFIGGTRTEIATGISLGIQASPDALIAKARAALDAGYKKVKIKIEPGHDVEWIGAARAALGNGAHLMADANNAYTLADMDRLVALD